MNYWYASRSDEMFLDLDSHRALRRAVTVLSVAMRTKKLPIESLWLYPTKQNGHAHMIVKLRTPFSTFAKLAWVLWMGNDRLRAAYVAMRQVDFRIPNNGQSCVLGGDLLVTKRLYYREPDAVCKCRSKHKPDSVTKKCPAMRLLLGEARSADYFSRTGPKLPGRKIRIPWGEVSISQIRKWSR